MKAILVLGKTFCILFITLLCVCCKQKNADNKVYGIDFGMYLNLPHVALTDSLNNLQTRLECMFDEVTRGENGEKYDEFWDKFIHFAKENNDKRLFAATQYRKIHILRYYQHDYATAQQQYRELADYCDKTGFKQLEIICYSQIADQYQHAHQWKACFETCDRLEPLIDNISYENFPDKAAIYHLIGTYFYFGKEFHVAQRYFLKALDAPKIPRNFWVILQCTNNMGLSFDILGESKEAIKWYQKILSEPFFKQYSQFPDWEMIAKTNIARVKMSEGNYREAIPVLKHAIAHFGDRDEPFCCGAAIDLTEAFIKISQIDSAIFYINKYLTWEKIDSRHMEGYFELMSLYNQTTGNLSVALAYRDSLRKYEQAENENLAVADVLYKKQEQKDFEIHIKEQKLQHNKTLLIAAVLICVLLVLALGIWIYYSRQILRKNRELVRKAQQWANVAPVTAIIADADEETEPEEELPKTAEPNEMYRLLFAEIERLIEYGLYKESNLSLDMLAVKTSQNPTYISKAVSHCTGKTFKTWLNEYRIKEAVRLLSDKNKPTVSIEKVAWDSGFNDRKTFHRIFKQITGLSPTDFKKNELHK